MFMHLNSELALDILDGRTDSSKLPNLDVHVEQCSSCGRQLDEWRTIHSMLGRPHLASAPGELLRTANSIFEPAHSAAATGIRKIVAALVFDSFAQPAFAGARGVSEARQVVLRAEEFDVHVKISGDAEQRQMIGQIFPRNESRFIDNAQLQLLKDGQRVGLTMVDEFGGFQFEEVPQGTLSLQIDLPKLTVVGALFGTEAV
jgi:hypothetical protein